MQSMIRLRIIVTILLSTVFLAILLYVVASNVLLESYSQIENDTMRRNLTRIDEAIENYSNALGVKVLDWSQWDDSYVFVQDGNEEYIEANLADSTLVNLEINLMAFYDAQGELVTARSVDLQTGEPLRQEEILSELGSTGAQDSIPPQAVNGIVKLSHGLLITRAFPVLPTSGEGVPAGTLIFGRFLDKSLESDLATLTQLSLQIHEINSPNAPSDVRTYAQMVQKEYYAVQPLSETVLAGYVPITDPQGAPIAIVKVTSSREVFLQGKNTVAGFTLLTSGAILMFGLIILVLLEILLLRRFARLARDVEHISIDDLHKAKVYVGSEDSIGMLGKRINDLLFALAQAQERSASAANSAEVARKKLEASLKQTEEMNKLMIGRELKMAELKEQLGSLRRRLSEYKKE